CSPFRPSTPPRLSSLSLHDALPISSTSVFSTSGGVAQVRPPCAKPESSNESTPSPGQNSCSLSRPSACRKNDVQRASGGGQSSRDRKSTRLNSSHDQISYAVFCLKK